MKGTFERTLAWGAVLLAVFLVINAIVSHRNLRHIRDDASGVSHTHEVLQALGKLLGSLRDIESAQRGYVVTGDRRFFEPGDAALAKYAGQLEQVAALTSDNPAQAERVQALAELIDARLYETRQCVTALDRGDAARARVIVESGDGNRRMGSIRSVASELEAEEARLLESRRDSARRAFDNASASLFFGTAIGLASLAVIATLLARHLKVRTRDRATLLGQRELFRATLAAIDDAVIVSDLDGRVSYVNEVAERLTGWLAAEATGRPLGEILRLQSESDATNLIDREGLKHPVEQSVNPLRDSSGALAGEVIAVRDIAERRRSESALRALADSLAESDRRKDEFLATLAHELRNPLAPIRNGLEILRLTSANSTIDPICEVMNRQLDHLVRLVDDLLDVSRISRNKLTLRPDRIDLASAIRSAVEACQPLATAADVALHISLPDDRIELEADHTRLAQVFSNLLNNAVKYTYQGGRVELTAWRDGDAAVVRVADTGIGIPPDMLGRVFDLFAQIERSLDRAQGGLGIGLMLVKRLVEMHGGTVSAQSEGDGRGSAFTVRLPALPAATLDAPASSPDRAERPAKLRVLVVDDNRDSAESLSRLLELWGHEVRTAHDGEEALEVAESCEPDVLLLDLGLPKLNGLEVCRRLRLRPGGERLLIIAQSGWGKAEDRSESRRAGFDHHLVKPVGAEALQDLLAAHSAPARATTIRAEPGSP